MRLRVLLPIAMLLWATPSGALAEEDDPQMAPTATCVVQPLPTRGLESSVARITCQVAGAPATDTAFAVYTALAEADAATVMPGMSEPFCTASMSDGAGTCVGILRDLGSFISGRVVLTATLQPSGTQLNILPPDSPSAA